MAIGEIYFPWGKRPCHQICLYYNVHLVNDDIPLDGVIHGYDGLDDKRIDLNFCWISLEDLKNGKEQVYELCYKEISESCAQAKDRREYKKITKNIAQLIKWKGNDTAKSLIEELMQRYPRKPALLDELEKVEKKL